MNKKIASLILAVVLLAGLFSVVACNTGRAEAATVMNVSLNPEVEFILDGGGKVITVNALNEEGNLIISAAVFNNIEGKPATEAAKLFVQVAAETGYLVSGHVGEGENKVEISLSGNSESAQKLFDEIKSKVEQYLSKENISATIQQAKAITQEQLQKLVEECAPYLDAAQVKAMEYRQLLAELAASRKETAEMRSQELKKAYYEAKAFALEQAKMEILRSKLNVLEQALFDTVNNAYVQAAQSLENMRYSALVAETSSYQKALANLREKKVEYIKFRNEVSQMEQSSLTAIVEAQLNALQSALDFAESTLIMEGESANAAIDSAKATLDSAYESVMALFKNINVDQFANEISAKQTAALNTFFTRFETTYAAAEKAAKDSWQSMEDALKAPKTEG